jgi:N-acetylmuramoyl-L-alanine amidase
VIRANSKKADLFLSIHHDSVQPLYMEQWLVEGRIQYYSDQFKGYSIFVTDNNPRSQESLKFATFLADEFISRGMIFTKHHAMRIKGEGRNFLDERRGIYKFNELAVLRGNMAVAILLEAGVIVNREEELALALPQRRKLIANAIVNAVGHFCETQ